MHTRYTKRLFVALSILALVAGCTVTVERNGGDGDDEQPDIGMVDPEPDGGEQSTFYQLQSSRAGPGGQYCESQTYQLNGGVVGVGPTRSSSQTYRLESFARSGD